MKNQLLLFLLLFSVIIYGQNSEKQKSISIIEELSSFNEEMLVNSKTTTKIDYSNVTGKIEFKIHLEFVGRKDYYDTTTTFYLDDIIYESMVYDYYKLGDDKYVLRIEIKTKNKSVSKKTIDYEEKLSIPITNTTTSNVLKLYPSGNSLSMYSLKKYIEQVKILLDITESKRENIILKELNKNN